MDKGQPNQPAPEALKPRSDDGTPPSDDGKPDEKKKPAQRFRRTAYRPGHKGMFIGLIVVILILGINAAVIVFVLKNQEKLQQKTQGQVTISQSALDKLGVNRSSVSDLGVILTVNPDAKFAGKVTIGKDLSVGGQLQLNSTLNVSDAKLTQLESGKTAVGQLNVNGSTSLTNAALRGNLNVTGTSLFQGVVTMSQLLTVNNNVNIAGSLAVGGTLSVASIHVSTFTVDSSITVGGHIVTRGSAPYASAGSGVGSNGTVSLSGTDVAGSIAVNFGVGASGGNVVNVTFHNAYGTIPAVIVTPVGRAVTYYIDRSASGFSIYVSGAQSAGGMGFDYQVIQ